MDKNKIVSISPKFKLIFIADVILAVLSLIIAFAISFYHEPTDLQKSLFDTCSTTWKIGFGVLIGLIGGKTQ